MRKSKVMIKCGILVFLSLILCMGHLFSAPCGDVNSSGNIDIIDALMIAQYSVGLNPAGFDAAAADVNGDSVISIIDALQIAQFSVELISVLPGCAIPPTSNPTCTPVTYELQAESAKWDDAVIETTHAGFTGSGYVNTANSAGRWIEWSFNLSAASGVKCVFRYAHESGDRPMTLSANGSTVSTMSFPATGAWTAWTTISAEFNLSAGGNIIRLTATNSSGAPNIDKMDLTVLCGTVIGPTLSPVPTPTVPPTPTTPPTPTPSGMTPLPPPIGVFDTDVPVGWAVVSGYGIQTTTGGAGGEVVTATSNSQLAGYAGGDTPLIIRVQGTLTGSNVNVGSNKTIIGTGTNAKLSGFYLNLNQSQNVIIRNLTVTGGTDAIAARYSNHLWIDHVDTFSCGDGLIDITRESDMYTVSWARFSKHHKTMLLNGGSTHSSDKGKLNGTVHHCWFDGSDTRNPRAGFGMIHVLNNLYNNNGYCIGLHSYCKVVAESNYFKNTKGCIHQMYTTDKNNFEYGSAISINNIFDNSSEDDSDGVGFTVTNYYLYNFMAHSAADVPAAVQASVGPKAEYGEIGLMPIPGQGAVGVTSSTLSWKTGTYSASSYNVYFGTTTSPPHVSTTTSTSFNAGSLNSGVTYYWCVDQVTSSGTIKGKLWTFRAQ